MARKQKHIQENKVLLENMRKIYSASGYKRQGEFFQKYLKGLPGAPEGNTGGSADEAMSGILNGARPVPVSFLPVFSELGNVSIDRLVTGKDWSPKEKEVSYGDVLHLLVSLLKKDAIELTQDGNGVVFRDPVLSCMMSAINDLNRLRENGFPDVGVDATVQGLLSRDELQEPVYDASDDAKKGLRTRALALVQRSEDIPLEQMMEMIQWLSF